MSYTSAPTKVTNCTCKHAFQDERYGKGMRLHNPCKRKDNGTAYRCTVCGKDDQ